MASIKQMETKDGRRFFQISVSRGYGKAPYKKRWYWPDGWSKRTAERETAKIAAEFERACAAGEIMNREQTKEKAAKKAAEEAKIRTFKQYGEQVFCLQSASTAPRKPAHTIKAPSITIYIRHSETAASLKLRRHKSARSFSSSKNPALHIPRLSESM